MADDIVTRLRDKTVMDWEGDEAADEIERLRALIVGFATAHSNRQGNVGDGVETWNAFNRAIDALLDEADRQGVGRD